MRHIMPVILVLSFFLVSMLIPRSPRLVSQHDDGTIIRQISGSEMETKTAITEGEDELYMYRQTLFHEEKCFLAARGLLKIYKPVSKVEVVNKRVRFKYLSGPYVECKIQDNSIRMKWGADIGSSSNTVSFDYVVKNGGMYFFVEGVELRSFISFTRFGNHNLSYREWLSQTDEGKIKLNSFIKEASCEAKKASARRLLKRYDRIGGTALQRKKQTNVLNTKCPSKFSTQ